MGKYKPYLIMGGVILATIYAVYRVSFLRTTVLGKPV